MSRADLGANTGCLVSNDSSWLEISLSPTSIRKVEEVGSRYGLRGQILPYTSHAKAPRR